MFYRYLKNLSIGKAVLWCYVIWYLVTLAYHFDPSPRLWLNSLGLRLGAQRLCPGRRKIHRALATRAAFSHAVLRIELRRTNKKIKVSFSCFRVTGLNW